MKTEIKTSKQIDPKIYAYTTPTVTDNEGWIKIGYTERDVEQRIKEQTHTANIKTDIRWTRLAQYLDEAHKGKPFKDHDFHQFLKYHNIERKVGTEWFYFNGTPEKSEQLFEKFVHHDFSGFQPGQNRDYHLRNEQAEAVSLTKTYAEAHPNGEFLWNAKPRFGKTLTSYDLMKKLDANTVLIVTNRPAIANSWYDDFDQFIAGNTSYKFVSESDSLKDRPTLSRDQFLELVNAHLGEDIRLVAFVSLQDLKGSQYFGGAYDKLKWVADTSWDLLIIDEAHEAIDTFKTDVAFRNIKRQFTLHLSGTPFKALAVGKFAQDQIFNWSYADEQAAKENWPKDSEEENPYENLPQLNMFTYQMSHMIYDTVSEGAEIGEENIDYAFDLNEFFATNDAGKFIHEDAVESWLGTLTRNEKYPFSTKELRNELKHTFWLLDRVASAKALKKLLEDHPVFENYEIVLAAGDGKMDDQADSAILKSIDAVRKAIKENDKTITLSVGQLTTGVTIPEWSAVLMLSNIKSPGLYMQAAFRAQNPYSWVDKGTVYRKENAYVFDFAPERTLILFDEFANNLSLATAGGRGTSATREENIRELLNFFPVIAEDREGKMVEIDAKALMTIPKQIKAQEVLKRGFMSNLLFDNIAGIFQAHQTVLDILDELPVEEQGKITVSDSQLDLQDVQLDEEGQPLISDEIIINKQLSLFGEKRYALIDKVDKIVDESSDTTTKTFVKELQKEVAEALLPELEVEYQFKVSERRRIDKQVGQEIENLVKHSQVEWTIKEAHIKDSFKEKLAEASEDEKVQVREELAIQLEESKEQHQKEFATSLKESIDDLPQKLIEQQEVKRVEQLRDSVQEEIRGHLRGFARTIPSFIMAYGDGDLTLDNFDTYVPDKVFKEVTGITLHQFRYLRDGGEGFAGHLFDRATFDEAIQEFLRKKSELSDYFEDNKEDIFDYIPPQKTNQIFTPKKVVKRMVDELEKENPGIFDDSSKTFIDPYMKSGLYIAELVKRLYNSPVLSEEFPDREQRLKHILESQVYGFAPSEIIYRIATNFIFGDLSDTISRKNFIQEDTIPYAKDGKMQDLVDRYFG